MGVFVGLRRQLPPGSTSTWQESSAVSGGFFGGGTPSPRVSYGGPSRSPSATVYFVPASLPCFKWPSSTEPELLEPPFWLMTPGELTFEEGDDRRPSLTQGLGVQQSQRLLRGPPVDVAITFQLFGLSVLTHVKVSLLRVALLLAGPIIA